MASGEARNLEELKRELQAFFESLRKLEEKVDKKARKEVNEYVKEVAFKILLKASENKDLSRLFVANLAYECFKSTTLAKKVLKVLRETLEIMTEPCETENDIWLDLAAELSVPK